MPDLRRRRRQLRAVIALLLFVDIAIAGYLVSPSGRSNSLRQKQYVALKNELALRNKRLEPLRGIDRKLRRAQGDIREFYVNRLPEQASTVSETLGQLASANGVRLSNVKYDYRMADVSDLRQVVIEARVSGDYPAIAKYVNALERSKIFFLLDGISLVEEQSGKVNLQLKLETYMRNVT